MQKCAPGSLPITCIHGVLITALDLSPHRERYSSDV
jgi:hypothetical protein